MHVLFDKSIDNQSPAGWTGGTERREETMAGYRMDRTSEDIMREITAILRTVKDPRVTTGMLSVVRVDVTNDMSYAKVYVSAMEGIETAKNAVKGLMSAQGYIRRELGSALHLRHVPELRFVADDSMEYSVNIAKKLNEIERGADRHE
jgi:ribosome-binding factor A